jgi:hypothetical protein
MKVTINVERHDLIEMGLEGEGEDVPCSVNPAHICFYFPSYDLDKEHLGTKIHFVNGEGLWCYQTYKEVEAMVNAELR